MADAPKTELSRDLGVFTITMVGVGAMIGAGIFVLTGIAAGTAGPALILVFAANALITLLTAVAYAELGSAIPEAGGGYLWVKEGLPGPNAFLAGWMSWFAHAVAGSLYALGFGSYFALVFEELGVQILGMPPHSLEKVFAVAIALAFIGINFIGVSETGMAGNVITVLKVAIIGVFVVSGLSFMFDHPVSFEKFTPFAPTGLGGIFAAMGLTFIAFEGYEIIVQTGEESRNPKKDIPRAVFWSLAIVIPIYILVSITALGAVTPDANEPTWQWLGNRGELGLAEAARQFMPFGTTLLLIGGLLSTMSALNATTFSSTRVSFAMGRDRNLPDFFASVHEGTRTPYLALFASGAMIILMAVFVPIEDVAAGADVMFMLLFLQVNVALITLRRRHSDKLDYGYLVPFFPWVTILAIVTQTFLAAWMFQFSPLAWAIVAGWLAVGLAIYYAWAKARQPEERVAPVVLAERVREVKTRYRVLVPVANPDTAEALIDLGAAVARANEGEVVVLHAITIPRQSPFEVGRRYVEQARERVVDRAVEMLRERNVPTSAVVRIGRAPAATILKEIEDREIDAVVMGWRGEADDPDTVLGGNIDRVLRRAPCDVLVLRARGLGTLRRVVVPVRDTMQATLQLDVAHVLHDAFDADLQLLHLVPPGATEPDRNARRRNVARRLAEASRESRSAADLVDAIDVDASQDVPQHIATLSTPDDLVVFGAPEERWFRRTVLGARSRRIAELSDGPVLLVKRAHGPLKESTQQAADALTGAADGEEP